MKEIKAYIRPFCASRVIQALEAAGAQDLTLIRVDSIKPLSYRGQTGDASGKFMTRYSAIAKLELVCRDKEAKLFVEIIRARSHTGARGDGRVFLSQVDGAVNIRTGQTGNLAL